MSVRNFKKSLNKAGQYMNEKVLKAERTEKTEEFHILEKKTDATQEVMKAMVEKLPGVLQPNPAARVKVAAMAKMSRQSTVRYPHAESVMGEIMIKGSGEVGEDSTFGLCLRCVGTAMKELAECRDNLDVSANQNFIDPLNHLLSKELREIQHHRKKTESRRLDFDGKKRKQNKGGSVSEAELQLAEEKFEESYELSFNSMSNFIDNDVEQVIQLQALVNAMLECHQGFVRILQQTKNELQQCVDVSNGRPRVERVCQIPRLASFRGRPNTMNDSTSSDIGGISEETASNEFILSSDDPHCIALYDFAAENEGELSFYEGDVIMLLDHIDENWLEGELNGNTGYFPAAYVNIKTDCNCDQ